MQNNFALNDFLKILRKIFWQKLGKTPLLSANTFWHGTCIVYSDQTTGGKNNETLFTRTTN